MIEFRAATTSPEMPLRLPISCSILSVACLAWLARPFTSDATTAKPRPASPARADSIVAFNASRLIWPVIAPISCTMLLIDSDASVRRCACWSAASTRSTAVVRGFLRLRHGVGDFAHRHVEFLGAGGDRLHHAANLLAAHPRDHLRRGVGGVFHDLVGLAVEVADRVVGGLDPDLPAALADALIFARLEFAAVQVGPERAIAVAVALPRAA